jgi:hypothetical protein
MEDKKKLVLCCECEHSIIDVNEDIPAASLYCFLTDETCLIGPHECPYYEENPIPF